MGRATVRAALAAAMVLGAQPAAAMAQEPVAPASPEALHGQIVAALKAQPMVGVTMTAGDDDVPEMTTVTGVYDVKGQRFSGTVESFGVKVKAYATRNRTLVRVVGRPCWEVETGDNEVAPASESMLLSPADLIDKKQTLGPALFALGQTNEVTWSLKGKAPANVTELYDPLTMLPVNQTARLTIPNTMRYPASTMVMSVEYSCNDLKITAPKNPKICKAKKKKKTSKKK